MPRPTITGLLAAAATAAALALPAEASVLAFNNLDPNGGFSNSAGLGLGPIAGNDAPAVQEAGTLFDAAATGPLMLVEAPFAAFDPFPTPAVTLTLYPFVAGGLGGAIQAVSADVVGDYDSPQMVSFTGWGASLTTGLSYVLLASTDAGPGADLVWLESLLLDVGAIVSRLNGGPPAIGGEPAAPALRVTVSDLGEPAPVPLPAGLPLLALGVGLLALKARRRKR